MKKCFVLLCILIFASNIGFSDYQDEINKLARECQAGKKKSCEKLAKKATEDKNSEVRKAATEKLSDQVILTKIARTDKEMDVRLAAVKNLADQTTLAEIAKMDSARAVREGAVNNLISQDLLLEIAKTASDSEVCKKAVERLDDQGMLIEIARTAVDWRVRQASVIKLTDQTLLAEIAKKDTQKEVWQLAMEKLIDQGLLLEIAKTASDSAVCKKAVERLEDQAMLIEIARTAGDWRVRQAAVKKLTNQPALAEIVRKDGQRAVRQSAMERLTDQGLIAEIAKTDLNAATRSVAVLKLTDQTVIGEIAWKDKSWYVRSLAVQKLIDQPALTKIARKDSDPNVRSSAVWQLVDQTILAEIAKRDKDSYVREAAGEKLRLGSLPDISRIATEIEVIEKVELQAESIQFTLAAGDPRQLLALVIAPQMDGFFDNNRLVLIDQDGNPYKYVAVAPILRHDTGWIANGGPIPLDRHDMTITFKSDGFTTEFKPAQGNPRVNWSGAEARFRIIFEVTKGSHLLSLRFGPLPPVPVFQVDQPSQDYFINDEHFIDRSQPDSYTDAIIIGANEKGFECAGILEIRHGNILLFANRAMHTWKGTITAFGYVFSSDPNQPLTFMVAKDKGYTYMKGTGTIKFPDGRTVILTDRK